MRRDPVLRFGTEQGYVRGECRGKGQEYEPMGSFGFWMIHVQVKIIFAGKKKK